MAELIPLFVAIPLGAAFLMALLGKLTKGTAHLDAFAILVTGVLLAMAIVLVAQGGAGKEIFLGGWNGEDGRPIGISMVCDGLSRLRVPPLESAERFGGVPEPLSANASRALPRRLNDTKQGQEVRTRAARSDSRRGRAARHQPERESLRGRPIAVGRAARRRGKAAGAQPDE